MDTIAFILARKNSMRIKNKHNLKIKNLDLIENTIKFAYKLQFYQKNCAIDQRCFFFKQRLQN